MIKEVKVGLWEKLYIPEILKGLSVTTKHFFRNLLSPKNIVTIQYPDVKREIAPVWRGRHRLLTREDGSLKCVACFMCATACPSKCIYIEAGEHPDPSIEKYPVRFEIDLLKCVFCGMCVEACPKDAIAMDLIILDLAGYERKDFILDINKLVVKP